MTSRNLALALVLSIPVLAGCDPASKLHGKWDMETEDPQEEAAKSGMGTYIPSAIVGFMKLKMNLEFKYDGNFIAEAKAGGESAQSRGKWSLVKMEGDTMVVKVELQGQEEQEVQIKFLDGNRIEMAVPPVGDDQSWSGQTATFERRPF